MIHLLRTSSKTKAYHIATGPEGVEFEAELMACCHCGRQWEYKPGSGKDRAWCNRCKAITCGSKKCDPCTPYNKDGF